MRALVIVAVHPGIDARMFMVFDGCYKLIHAEGGFRPILFDLETDPDEFVDLGESADHTAEIDRLYRCLAQWGRRLAQRVTKSENDIERMRGKSQRKGVLTFLADGTEVPEEWLEKYTGTVKQNYVGR